MGTFTYADYKSGKNPLDDFKGLFFAFNKEQFEQGMKKVGATSKCEILSIGAGGYLLKTKEKEFDKVLKQSKKRLATLLKDKDFLVSALKYELANYEYCITYDVTDALEALKLDVANLTDLQKECLDIAKKEYMAEMEGI